VKHGVYDEVDKVDPALLHRYYGAGSSLESSGEADSPSGGQQSRRDIAEIIAASQSHNIRHEAAAVANNSSPFENKDSMEAFILALDVVLGSGTYPNGFNLREEYESFESYKTGRSTKPLVIPLPYNVWFPRIVVWCKALDLLKRFPLCKAALS
jgi:hypothetical protein